MIRILVLLFSFLIFCQFSFAELQFPKKMPASDRRKTLETLGLSTAPKVLGNPYPLGGYSGVEIGYSTEVVGTGEISNYGDRSVGNQKETSYSLMTLGKGLYNNLDIFLQFSPFQSRDKISNYGGQIRWGFYQAEYLPAYLSFVGYASSTNFQNQIITVVKGADLVVGFSVQDLTLYTGIGFAQSSGIFSGGADGVTDNDVAGNGETLTTNSTKTEEVSSSHYVAGVNVKYSKLFLALEIDRFTQSIYSAKLGFRF